MFHRAFDFRDKFVTGCTPRPSGVGSEKPWMPCWNGRFPVAMEVHSIGDSGGCSVEICAIAPRSTSRWTLGILPASINGWITFQSAASHPINKTLRATIPTPTYTPRRYRAAPCLVAHALLRAAFTVRTGRILYRTYRAHCRHF